LCASFVAPQLAGIRHRKPHACPLSSQRCAAPPGVGEPPFPLTHPRLIPWIQPSRSSFSVWLPESPMFAAVTEWLFQTGRPPPLPVCLADSLFLLLETLNSDVSFPTFPSCTNASCHQTETATPFAGRLLADPPAFFCQCRLFADAWLCELLEPLADAVPGGSLFLPAPRASAPFCRANRRRRTPVPRSLAPPHLDALPVLSVFSHTKSGWIVL